MATLYQHMRTFKTIEHFVVEEPYPFEFVEEIKKREDDTFTGTIDEILFYFDNYLENNNSRIIKLEDKRRILFLWFCNSFISCSFFRRSICFKLW